MSKGWSKEDIPDQSGVAAIVTGANSGIGLVAARELAGKGATVIVACRNLDKGNAAVEQMRGELAPNGGDAKFDVQALDLADLSSVRAFVDRIKAAYPDGIDLLVNNAGVMAPPRHETADGFELQFGTNHLGHFALTGLLLGELKKKPGARIVTLSSNGHKMGKLDFDDLQSEQGYKRWSAYAQSKLANLVFAIDLQTRLGEAGLEMKSMGAHPGVSHTNLTATGNDLGSSFFSIVSKPFLKLSDLLLAQDAEHGALPTLYAATKEDLPGGSYIGPDGMGELRGSPTIVAPRKVAHNVEVADRLWKESVNLTGIDYDFSQPTVTA
ncbi:MAG: SDR family oxidoreductase [Thermoleophilia bacterium]|nr:SDR family oxidoreductase [Thermoleophilia bacterium]